MRPLILTYHSLDPTGSVISVAPGEFARQLDSLSENGIRVVPLEQIRNTPRAVSLTFDDGFANFREHALPALVERRMTATVFVISRYCGMRNDWPTQPAFGIPQLGLMKWSELDDLIRGGIQLGAHTATHPFLTKLKPGEVDREMTASRNEIEQRTGRAVTTFAYPYGDWSPPVRDIAARHFQLACTTDMGWVGPNTDPHALPRMDVYYLRDLRWFHRLSRPSGAAYLAARSALRSVRRMF